MPLGAFTLPTPVWSTIDNAAVLIAGAAALLLIVLRFNMPLVLLLAACLGIVIKLIEQA
jgi:chromate transporter